METHDQAEGSPEAWEIREPKDKLESSEGVLTDSTKFAKLLSETGTISTLSVRAEARENGDDQDASQTEDETKPTPTPKTAIPEPSETGKDVKVLIVEDMRELAEVMQATIESMKLQTAWVPHGDSAIEKFKEIVPDIVLLDIALPDMSGWQILEEFKAHAKQALNGKMPIIIVITAYGDPANRLIAKLQDIHSYIVKPIKPDQVEWVVTKAMDDLLQ
jgi:CheY-like chemotaxis protein